MVPRWSTFREVRHVALSGLGASSGAWDNRLSRSDEGSEIQNNRPGPARAPGGEEGACCALHRRCGGGSEARTTRRGGCGVRVRGGRSCSPVRRRAVCPFTRYGTGRVRHPVAKSRIPVALGRLRGHRCGQQQRTAADGVRSCAGRRCRGAPAPVGAIGPARRRTRRAWHVSSGNRLRVGGRGRVISAASCRQTATGCAFARRLAAGKYWCDCDSGV